MDDSVLTLSLGAWMEMPDMSFDEWAAEYRYGIESLLFSSKHLHVTCALILFFSFSLSMMIEMYRVFFLCHLFSELIVYSDSITQEIIMLIMLI